MLRKSLIPLALGLMALVAAPALAEGREVVYFTNGTTMTVDSHSIEEDQILVDLGGGSYMAFPSYQIDKIETATGEIAIARDGVANRMVPNRSTNQSGRVPSRKIRGSWEGVNHGLTNEAVTVDKRGVTVYRPFVNGPANKAQFGVSGRRELRNMPPARSSQNGELIGTSRFGTRNVMPPKGKGALKRTLVGFAQGPKHSKKDDD